MGRLDLTQAQGLQVANQEVIRVRNVNQDIYRAPYFNNFEDGSMPFTTSKSNPSVVPVNTTLMPTRSGTRSIRYGQDTANHATRVDDRFEWLRGDEVSVWITLMPNTEANPAQARLGGLCVANAETSDSFGLMIDGRNGSSGSTAALQIREIVGSAGTATATGVPVSERINYGTWYRITAFLTATEVIGQVFNARGALIGSVSRELTTMPHPSKAHFGIYNYGWSVFDDYQVTPNAKPV